MALIYMCQKLMQLYFILKWGIMSIYTSEIKMCFGQKYSRDILRIEVLAEWLQT
jgi:hypothetical protein